MTPLSELIASLNVNGLSARAIARRAQEQGHTLNHDTAARYLRGDHGRPDESTLVALASVLKAPLADLRAAAGLPSELTTPYTPPTEASRLTRRQRLAVDEIIRAMLDTGRSATVSELPARGKRATSSRDAARRGKAEPPHR